MEDKELLKEMGFPNHKIYLDLIRRIREETIREIKENEPINNISSRTD